jgi:2-polyprenyl-3-methyl-5-hydroxy-6-metoxy-1,4-benzoquinol methylase
LVHVQVESFLLVLRPLLAAAAAAAARQHGGAANELHVVDFGCGTGNLLLPLAALFPAARFTGVDMKPAALRLLQQRATAAGLSNVAAAGGMIEQFSQPFKFDVALALHACGNATDHVLQMAVDQGAAFVVSPCCVGE